MSLAELSTFCAENVGPGPTLGHEAETRRYDIPYFVTDSALAEASWGWAPQEPITETLASILRWARAHRDLLDAFAQ